MLRKIDRLTQNEDSKIFAALMHNGLHLSVKRSNILHTNLCQGGLGQNASDAN